jgi:hypothetical protein
MARIKLRIRINGEIGSHSFRFDSKSEKSYINKNLLVLRNFNNIWIKNLILIRIN